MKTKLFLIAMIGLSIGMTSCKKKIYGCMDETALNYSSVATEDGKDCIYQENIIHEDEVLISNTVLNVAWQTWGNTLGITMTWPEITQSVLDNGVVDVYIRWNGSNEWQPMPFSMASGYTNVTFSYYVAYRVGEVDLVIEADDNILPDPHPNADIKIVILK